jgi:peroxiredoxin
MKKLLFALTAIAALTAFNTNEAPLPIGAAMPKGDVKMKDVTGKTVSLQDAKTANGLLVMFTCNTCPYVVKNQGRTKEVCKYAMDKKIGVILLNSNEANRASDDSYAEMQSYAKDQGYNWYYAVDSDNVLADAFGADRTPECFLFDKDGKLVYHGAIDDNPGDVGSVSRTHLKEALNEMTAGKDVSVKQSRSVGCGIKRKG